MWKAESEEVRGKFRKEAEELKQQHLKDHPGYAYRPRRPCEKKKRMTAKKAAKIEAKKAKKEALAAENRKQSQQIVEGFEEANQRIQTYPDSRLFALPFPEATAAVDEMLTVLDMPDDGDFMSMDFLTHKLPFEFGVGLETGLTQAADMGFFPAIDIEDPQLQSLLEEVGEAYEAGYYDDQAFEMEAAAVDFEEFLI
jgi:hypothetical protein